MSEATHDPVTALPPVQIRIPEARGIFSGTATGLYDPAGGATITCYFWKEGNTGSAADSQAPGLPTMGGRGWTATFPTGGMTEPTTQEAGILRAVRSNGGQDEKGQLSWYAPPGQPLNADEKAQAVRPHAGPPILIESPTFDGSVHRLFLVHGSYNPEAGRDISVALFRLDGSPAHTLVLPTVHLGRDKWTTAVLSLESGEGYLIRATLKRTVGGPISHAVAPIKIH